MKFEKSYCNEWITDRLPDRDGEFLVTVVNDVNEVTVCAASYKAGHWGTESKSNRLTVIAWAEMPEPFSESKRFLHEECKEMSDSFDTGFEAGLNEEAKQKAPLRCRIQAKLVGISSSAVMEGCFLGRHISDKKCSGCPERHMPLSELIERMNENPFMETVCADYADIENVEARNVEVRDLYFSKGETE